MNFNLKSLALAIQLYCWIFTLNAKHQSYKLWVFFRFQCILGDSSPESLKYFRPTVQRQRYREPESKQMPDPLSRAWQKWPCKGKQKPPLCRSPILSSVGFFSPWLLNFSTVFNVSPAISQHVFHNWILNKYTGKETLAQNFMQRQSGVPFLIILHR